jgi:UDP-N-acetyl-D-mannosaminuronate dehydrogenase
VVVLVDHREFKSVDKSELARKVVIDTRGIY